MGSYFYCANPKCPYPQAEIKDGVLELDPLTNTFYHAVMFSCSRLETADIILKEMKEKEVKTRARKVVVLTREKALDLIV